MAEVTVKISHHPVDWACAEDSDEDGGPQVARHASEVYERREIRLASTATAARSEATSLSDKEVKVVAQTKEWTGVDDSDGEDGPPIDRHASETFERREQRLAAASAATGREEVIMADKEVNVSSQVKDWAGADDSDEDGGPLIERHASETFERREKRLSFAVQAAACDQAQVLADMEVPITSQVKDWVEADDSDEDGPPIEHHASHTFERREQRLAHASAAVQNEDKSIADKEVAITSQTKDWVGADDSDEGDGPPIERHASNTFERREQRLAFASAAVQDECKTIADTEVAITSQTKDWAEADDSDEDCGPQIERHASETFERRERRLVSASVAPQNETGVIADEEVIVMSQAKD